MHDRQCCHCGAEVKGDHLRAVNVMAGSRTETPKPVQRIIKPVRLCKACAGRGISLSVEVEWRGDD